MGDDTRNLLARTANVWRVPLICVALIFAVTIPPGIATAAPPATPALATSDLCVVSGTSLPAKAPAGAQCPSGAAARSTPVGYTLEGQRYSNIDYYAPARTYQAYDRVTGTVLCQVKISFLQSVDGGPSLYWYLTTTVSTDFCGGDVSWVADYNHYCGVNLPEMRDPTCYEYWNEYHPGTLPEADLEGTLPTPTHEIIYNFGSGSYVTKFPLLKLGVLFTKPGATGAYTDQKFRGWDVCVRPTYTRLCTDTGRGD